MQPKVVIVAAALLLVLQIAIQMLVAQQAHAATTLVVDSLTDDGWTKADTRANGQTAFIEDETAPFGEGALSLKTDASPAPSQDKAQFMMQANVPLATVVNNPLYYSTKQNSASFAAGLPSYQLPINLLGVNGGFTTLVYEPYTNEGNDAVKNGEWQQWNVGEGKFWSTRAVGSLQPSQGTYQYTLAQILAEFPDAVVIGTGVNIGSNNPGYDTEVDGFAFNGTVYDFDPAPVAPAVPAGLGFAEAGVVCGGATNIRSGTFRWDTGTKVANYTYQITRPGFPVVEGTVTGTSAPAFSFFFEGQYSFKVRANGTNGLQSAWSAPCDSKYDRTAPTVRISSPSFMNARGENLTVAGTTSTDVASVDVRLGGVSIGQAPVAVNGAWALTIPTPASIEVGKYYTFTVTAKDAAGNTGQASVYTYFTGGFPWM